MKNEKEVAEVYRGTTRQEKKGVEKGIVKDKK